MPLTYRLGSVFNGSAAFLTPQTSGTVTVYEPGAIASAASTGTTITVHAGHGIAASDRILVGTDLLTYRLVSSVTSTTVVVGSAVNVSEGDIILNLGLDNGLTSPEWDGSQRSIYDNPTGGTALTDSAVTLSDQGEYEYYHQDPCWEVIRSGDDILDIVQVTAGNMLGATSSTDNAIVRWDGTTGKTVQDYTSNAPTIGDTGQATFPAKVTFQSDTILDGVRQNSVKRRDHIWASLRSSYDDVGIYHRDDHDREHYVILQRLDPYRWWGWEFFDVLTGTGGTNCNALSLHHIYKAFLSIPHDDASVTESGTWTAGGSNASAYNNTYRASVTTDDYVEWTAPASTTDLGIRTVCATNGGLAKVTIGGDATAANMLYTAQQLVDAGEYPSSILVANGGTLNPTDRVLDFDARAARTTNYADTLEYDVFIPIAVGLAAAAHVVRLTVTGYKYTSSTDYKVYSSGYLYRIATTAMADANVVPMRVENVMSVPRFKDSIEYAISYIPDGGSYLSFIGNRAHGYDQQTALTIVIDGATTTTTQDTLYLGKTVELKRVSQLRHPDYGGGTSTAADVTVFYRMNRDGFAIAVEMDWNIDVTVGTNYMTMFAVSRDKLDKGSTSSMSTDFTFVGGDSNPGSTSEAGDLVYAWDSDGNIAVAAWVPDTTMTCNDFPMTTHKVFWVDYSNYAYAKAYFSRSRSGQVDEAVSTGDKFRAFSVRRLAYLMDANRFMARS